MKLTHINQIKNKLEVSFKHHRVNDKFVYGMLYFYTDNYGQTKYYLLHNNPSLYGDRPSNSEYDNCLRNIYKYSWKFSFDKDLYGNIVGFTQDVHDIEIITCDSKSYNINQLKYATTKHNIGISYSNNDLPF